MYTWSLLLDLLENVTEWLFDAVGAHARVFESLGAGRDERLNFNCVAGFDPQYRRRLRVVITPRNCFWRGLKLIRLSSRCGRLLRAQRNGKTCEEKSCQNHVSPHR